MCFSSSSDAKRIENPCCRFLVTLLNFPYVKNVSMAEHIFLVLTWLVIFGFVIGQLISSAEQIFQEVPFIFGAPYPFYYYC